MSLSIFLPLLCDDLAHQIPFQEALHTPSASGTGTLASPPLMLKHQTAVYFPPPHKWIIPCSEIPHHAGTSSSICFRNQFAVSQMSQVTTGSYLRTYVTMEIIKTPQRHSNIWKPLYILIIHKARLNLALKMIRTPSSFRKLRHGSPKIPSSIKNCTMYKLVHRLVKQVISIVITRSLFCRLYCWFSISLWCHNSPSCICYYAYILLIVSVRLFKMLFCL